MTWSFLTAPYQRKLMVLLGMATLTISACSSSQFSDLFTSYSHQLSAVRNAQLTGDLARANDLLPDASTRSTNYALLMLERGRLQFLMANWQQSRADFTRVTTLLDEQQATAKLRLSRGLANASSLLSNDNVRAYDIPAYEQTMLYSYQALNYLFTGDPQGALVEVRRANQVQEQALADNQQAILDAHNEVAQGELNQTYPSMQALIGEVKFGFQNAYTFYLSGVLYEAQGQANDAYIDYKRALEIYPDNPYIQQSVLKLASQLHMQDDLESYSAMYGNYLAPQGSAGELVVILEQGLIAPKQEIAIDVPVFSESHGQSRFFSIAVPVYQGELQQYPAYQLESEQHKLAFAQVTQLQSLASRTLSEQIPGMVSRQILRLVSKEKLRSTLSKEGGELGNILATIYNIASEHADTRSWLTLPAQMSIARIGLPDGQHTIHLNQGQQSRALQLSVQSKRITLLYISQSGDFFSHNLAQL